MSEYEIVKDGEANLGRGATLFHRAFGPIDRANGRPQPVGGVVFHAPESPTVGTVYIQYTAEQLEEAWEGELFESPIHADEVLSDE